MKKWERDGRNANKKFLQSKEQRKKESISHFFASFDRLFKITLIQSIITSLNHQLTKKFI